MSCSNQVVRFALSDAIGVFGFDVTSKVEAGTQGLLVRGSTKIGGVCTDYSGNIYVADSYEHIILKIDEGGRISNFAGTPGVSGNDGAVRVANNSAHFGTPIGLCCDKSGNIYVADATNNQIRKISGGYVDMIAGSPAGAAGFVDGTGSIARFWYPMGMDVDSSGNLYVAEYYNHSVRKITQDGSVLTISGVLGAAAAGDEENVRANKYSAQLRSPWSLSVDAEGNVYVLDTGNHKIKKIVPRGWMYLHSGSGVAGHSLGTGTTPQYTCTYGTLTFSRVDKSGNMYVVDRGEGWTRLLRLNYNGVPSEIADFHGTAYVDCPIAVAVNPSQKLFVTFSDFETTYSSSSEFYSSSSSSS